MQIDWREYDGGEFYDELISSPGYPRKVTRNLAKYLSGLSSEEITARRHSAELAIKTMGISFTIYSEAGNIDRAWPFDIIPRVISHKEWLKTERGLIQRLAALNCFIDDIYNEQNIIKDKIMPAELITDSVNFRPECVGMKPPLGVWAHICGSDLIRDKDGSFYVLEDNLRVPSGVSYMMENRRVTKRIFPELFENHNILPVTEYPNQLFDTLAAISPRPLEFPEVVVLTPGIYNSAYFEHSYLAQQMGVELVEGSDLVVEDDYVFMRTINGLARVDVIYRRIDDLFLDPEVFNADSVLGVPGLMRAWQKGNVAIANAPGAGVADDKVIYTFVPDMIKYYLGEEPILPNVPSYLCIDEEQREYVLANLDKLVVKPANESGGYGMLIGPQASQKERDEFAALIKASPRNYMAQPLIALSTNPILESKNAEPRHVDLRPFVLQGRTSCVTAGGLTRVAMKKGSYVVNSSQGGGSQDTWIVSEEEK
ncbi:circularly permuted type 2 ATP-grasp protein [Gilvimarinus agarilyticus]|uniref:circularly permuted type 2 ATP-grasp protein n=1 Tax=unclassified Gilvimarinus TaxID=2642066 RepID=UPI001C08026F|nr:MULTISPECIES: circularly permuted type 2 ATP-grasp protein [unclassified Gilvimarinus]MBU2885027.1 circularly permuted type 2 ATP-grasp protein [Gilvimarinus agarilyticus]MDO6569924.1 circularly permuted type 2 ATP-grasp protein [Gilvimarinus sp. 2_MG-2023]MDO6747133.1 circularly permuted type 2 ATP-grasp protein [Gilvimarinus sp. 1_MG-2023]